MLFFKKKEDNLSPYLLEQAKQILIALGGKNNLTSIEACITRLRVKVIDKSKVNEDKLTKLGSRDNIWFNNKLHIVLGKNADFIANILNNI